MSLTRALLAARVASPLLSFLPSGGGTFTRASEGSYYTEPPNSAGNFLAWATNNIIREDRRDGRPGLYLFERGSTNLCRYSEALDDATWVKTLCSISGSTAQAPDPDLDCRTISYTADATAVCTQLITGTADATTYIFSLWARMVTGAGNIRFQFLLRDGTTATSANLPLTTTWTRVFIAQALGTGATPPSFGIRNGSAGTAQDVYAWGTQGEDGRGGTLTVPSSYIRTVAAAVTRQTDILNFASTPDSFRAGRWSQQVATISPSNGFDRVVLSFEGTAFNSCFNIRANVGPRIRDAAVDVFSRGNAITYSADQVVTYGVDIPNAQMSVSGATTGNGTGISGTVPTFANGVTEFGGNGSGGWVWARIGQPYALPPTRLSVGIQDFATTSFYRSAANVLAANSAPFGVAVAVYVRAVPSGSESIFALDGVIARGWGLCTLSGPNVRFRVINAAVAIVNSPTSAIVAADVGKVILFVGVMDGTTVRLYRAGAQVGAGTAITGYSAANATDRTAIGIRSSSDIDPAASLRVVGAMSFTGAPTLADIQAWTTATQTAGTVQDMGGTGVVMVDRWRADENVAVAASWVDGVAGQVLAKTGAALTAVSFAPVY